MSTMERDSEEVVAQVHSLHETGVPKAATPIRIDEKTQGLLARDNSELIRIIRVMMRGMAFPKTMDTEDKVIAAWNVAAALKVPPAIAIQNMAIINGSVVCFGQLPKALAEATGEMEDFALLLIDKDQKPILLENQNLSSEAWGAVCRVRRKGRTTNEYVFTMDDAKRAGLDRKSGPWREYTKIMLGRRAVAQAIRFEFPDALMGLNIAEYDLDVAPDLKDVTPSAGERLSRADELNKRFSQGGEDGTVQQ